jgi:hypothetical protein
MNTKAPAEGDTALTPPRNASLTWDWTPTMAFPSIVSSAPARSFAALPCAVKTSPRSSSCAIPSVASAAVSVSWQASLSPASRSLPGSNHAAGITPSTPPNAGSTSPAILTPPILLHPRQPKRNRTPAASVSPTAQSTPHGSPIVTDSRRRSKASHPEPAVALPPLSACFA